MEAVGVILAVTDGSPIAANNVSKAVLRAALHEVMARKEPNVFYWPSYEIVEWIGKYVALVWGQDGNASATEKLHQDLFRLGSAGT